MKISKTKLYDAFGELIYALAMADGLIQEDELKALDKVLADHPWASEIKWSFNYEKKKAHSLEDAYKKAIQVCTDYGPSEEYEGLINVLEKVASASEGMEEKEADVIMDFQFELHNRFHKELSAKKLF